MREAAEFRAAYHSTVLKGLKPETVYAYRVGDGTRWSEWLQFRTAATTAKPFTFLYMGDMQNNILSEASRTMRMAFRKAGDAAFVIHAGDLINRHDSDNEWGEWFAAGGFLYAQTPQMPTPGNHEYGRGPVLNPQWRRQYTLPETGPAGVEKLKETAWTVDYQGLRLISVDAPLFHGDEAMRAEMVRWLDGLLANNPNPWTALFLHFPLFSIDPDRDNAKVRDALKPLIDKYGVDLVLQAHDHGYARGAIGTGPMLNAGPARPSDHGSTYVVSVAGPKMYPVRRSGLGLALGLADPDLPDPGCVAGGGGLSRLHRDGPPAGRLPSDQGCGRRGARGDPGASPQRRIGRRAREAGGRAGLTSRTFEVRSCPAEAGGSFVGAGRRAPWPWRRGIAPVWSHPLTPG